MSGLCTGFRRYFWCDFRPADDVNGHVLVVLPFRVHGFIEVTHTISERLKLLLAVYGYVVELHL